MNCAILDPLCPVYSMPRCRTRLESTKAPRQSTSANCPSATFSLVTRGWTCTRQRNWIPLNNEDDIHKPFQIRYSLCHLYFQLASFCLTRLYVLLMPFAHHSLSKTPRFHVPCILRFLLMCRIWSVILLLHSLLQNRSQFTRSPKYIACCSFSEPVQRIHGNRCAPQHLSSSEQSYRQAASLPVLNLFRKSRISEKDPTELPCFT